VGRMKIAGVGLALAAVSCSAPDTTSDWYRSIGMERAAKGVIDRAAKNASSVEYRDWRFNVAAGVTCGEFNGQNSFGGPAGWKGFVFTPQGGAVEGVSDDYLVRSARCTSAVERARLQGAP